MRRGLSALVALLLLLPACRSPEERALEELEQQVSSVREAAESRDVVEAARRLAALRADVAKMRRENLLTEQQTQRILLAALQVQANLAWIAPEPAPPAPAPPPPAFQPDPPSNNSGGSVVGEPGQRGEKGKAGEPGNAGENSKRGRDRDDDDDDDD